MERQNGMLKMTKSSDLDRDPKQLARILREGETADGARVHWDDDGILNNVVEALASLDTAALEALASDVGIDLRETNASAERLCAWLQADRGQNSDTDPDTTGTDSAGCASAWIDATNVWCACAATVPTVKDASPSAEVYIFGGVNILEGGGVCFGATATDVPSAEVYAFGGVNILEGGGVCFGTTATDVPSARVYAFGGVNTLEGGGVCFGATATDVPSAEVYAFGGVNTLEGGGDCITLDGGGHYIGTAMATTSTTAHEFFPNPEFSLASQVFGAVCKHLREEQKHARLTNRVDDEDDEDDQTKLLRLDGFTAGGVPARLGAQYPTVGLDQLVAVSHTRNCSRSNRRDRD